VIFDPFGDFATEGYLRNVEKEKDLDIVKRLEHVSFTTGLDEAFSSAYRSVHRGKRQTEPQPNLTGRRSSIPMRQRAEAALSRVRPSARLEVRLPRPCRPRRLCLGSAQVGIGFRKLSPQQENLRRVVDP
jgi:hypothetical protein